MLTFLFSFNLAGLVNLDKCCVCFAELDSLRDFAPLIDAGVLLCTPRRLFFNLLLRNSVAVDCCCVEVAVLKGVLLTIPSLVRTDFVCTLSRGCVAKLPFPILLGKELGRGELIDVTTFALTGAVVGLVVALLCWLPTAAFKFLGLTSAGLILVTPGCLRSTDLCCTLGFTVSDSGLLGEELLADLY